MFKKINVTKLMLHRNHLTYVDGIDTLSTLTVLGLHSNKLRSLTGIGSLKNLVELIVASNDLHSLAEIEGLKFQQRNLSVENNPLEASEATYTVLFNAHKHEELRQLASASNGAPKPGSKRKRR